MQPSTEKRKSQRFPIHASIHIKDVNRRCSAITYSDDLSESGLSFYALSRIPPGSPVEVRIGVRNRVFKIEATAIYCTNRTAHRVYRTGISFKDSSDAFKAKLAEEIVLIKAYREQVIAETHREITEEEAAMEWIAKNAACFGRSKTA